MDWLSVSSWWENCSKVMIDFLMEFYILLSFDCTLARRIKYGFMLENLPVNYENGYWHINTHFISRLQKINI